MVGADRPQRRGVEIPVLRGPHPRLPAGAPVQPLDERLCGLFAHARGRGACPRRGYARREVQPRERGGKASLLQGYVRQRHHHRNGPHDARRAPALQLPAQGRRGLPRARRLHGPERGEDRPRAARDLGMGEQPPLREPSGDLPQLLRHPFRPSLRRVGHLGEPPKYPHRRADRGRGRRLRRLHPLQGRHEGAGQGRILLHQPRAGVHHARTRAGRRPQPRGHEGARRRDVERPAGPRRRRGRLGGGDPHLLLVPVPRQPLLAQVLRARRRGQPLLLQPL